MQHGTLSTIDEAVPVPYRSSYTTSPIQAPGGSLVIQDIRLWPRGILNPSDQIGLTIVLDMAIEFVDDTPDMPRHRSLRRDP